MEKQLINYFISENYISNWTIEDAFREIYQNFKDYGDYEIIKVNNETLTIVNINNSFDPTSTDLLIIGASDKSKDKLGKYGEGLKMAALVLLRNGYDLSVYCNKFDANFKLIDNNPTSNIKTLGVEITNKIATDLTAEYNFSVVFSCPINSFDLYTDDIIKPHDVIHLNEQYGSIVARRAGNIYVGDLFVCNLKGFNYAYNFMPSWIELDRDRKVPRDFQVKYYAGQIQNGFKEFDITGKSNDVTYASVPSSAYDKFTPKIINNKIEFVTEIVKEDGKETVIISDNFKEQLITTSYFTNLVNKLKGFLLNKLGVKEAALEFRNKYCRDETARSEFNHLMNRLGIYLDNDKKDDLPF